MSSYQKLKILDGLEEGDCIFKKECQLFREKACISSYSISCGLFPTFLLDRINARCVSCGKVRIRYIWYDLSELDETAKIKGQLKKPAVCLL